MKQILFLMSILCLFFCGCAATSTSNDTNSQQSAYYEGGDGSSFEQAVVFPGARSSADGIPLERRWISERYPGYRKGPQESVSKDNKIYDIQQIVTATGEVKTFYFDMTSWFGFPRSK